MLNLAIIRSKFTKVVVVIYVFIARCFITSLSKHSTRKFIDEYLDTSYTSNAEDIGKAVNIFPKDTLHMLQPIFDGEANVVLFLQRYASDRKSFLAIAHAILSTPMELKKHKFLDLATNEYISYENNAEIIKIVLSNHVAKRMTGAVPKRWDYDTLLKELLNFPEIVK